MHKSKNFSIELNGRLGNQLFGIALLIALEGKLRTKGALNLNRLEYIGTELTKIIKENQFEIKSFYKRILIERSPFEVDPNVFQILPDTMLRGYFQSPEYFKTYDSKIRSTILGSRKNVIQKKIPEIAIHVRRGDYVGNRFHGVCSDEYFISGVQILRSIWGPVPVKIFSDSKKDAAELRKKIKNSSIFIDEKMSPFLVLLNLSKYKFLVMSNSSFSYWAAYLSDKSIGEVIAPIQWTNFHNNVLNLDSMIRIDRKYGALFNLI
jgi:hypothetical protein